LDTRTIIEKLPNGYVNTRRNAGLKFIGSIYAYCIFNLLIKNNIFLLSTTAYYIISISIGALCIYNLVYYMDIIKYFKKIEILNYREINTIKLWVKLLLWMSIFILGYFALIPFVILISILIVAYLSLATGVMIDY
jgi:hypothetical protein